VCVLCTCVCVLCVYCVCVCTRASAPCFRLVRWAKGRRQLLTSLRTAKEPSSVAASRCWRKPRRVSAGIKTRPTSSGLVSRSQSLTTTAFGAARSGIRSLTAGGENAHTQKLPRTPADPCTIRAHLQHQRTFKISDAGRDISKEKGKGLIPVRAVGVFLHCRLRGLALPDDLTESVARAHQVHPAPCKHHRLSADACASSHALELRDRKAHYSLPRWCGPDASGSVPIPAHWLCSACDV
jgi:hypothetical protein